MNVKEAQRPRVCIIGAGPGGMSTLYQMKLHAADELDVQCYEKQETIGGMWNYTWRTGYSVITKIAINGDTSKIVQDPLLSYQRKNTQQREHEKCRCIWVYTRITGTDEYGEHVHASMYKNMWTIGPKEASEFSDYSFKDHFGKLLPSYAPRDITRQYLHGRFTKGKCGDLRPFVHFRHVVISVEYNDDADNLMVWIRDLPGNKDKKEIFSHVVVASGVFSVPNSPSFDGLSSFPGRIIHSHDFRDAKEFTAQTVLIIGARFSASEIAVQLIRFGAKHVICTYRNQPMNLKGTKNIEERPLLQKVDNQTVHFKDGTSAEVDSIILCTGYINSYPFLQGSIKYDTGIQTGLMPDNMYKGTIWTKGGNNKLLFLAPFEVYFNFSMFDIQAQWIYRYILGNLPNEPKPFDEMMESVTEWQERLTTIDSPVSLLAYQRDWTKMLAEEVGYPAKYVDKAFALLLRCVEARMANIWTYRSISYPTLYTDEPPPVPDITWDECKDDDDLVKTYTA